MNNTLRLLQRFGLTPRYRGYRQLLIALDLLKEDEYRMYNTKSFYAEIGTYSNSTATAVERNIRTLTERAWMINPKLLEEVAGYPMDYKPTNTDFLSIVYNYMIREDRPICPLVLV